MTTARAPVRTAAEATLPEVPPRHLVSRQAARTKVLLLASIMASFIAQGASPQCAHADEGDGAYGRLDGDLSLHAGTGAAFTSDAPAIAVSLAGLYLSTAGVYGHYVDALGGESAQIDRSIATGLRIQPLFLARFASDWERGPARFDLFVDSFALDIGAFWHSPRGGSLTRDPGLEFAASMGFPLFADATGVFLEARAALRWRADDLHASTAAGDIFERGALLSIILAWHHVVTGHLVDSGDRLAR